MLVSAIGKLNTFSNSYVKSQNSFGTVKTQPEKKCPKPMVKSDFKTNFKG